MKIIITGATGMVGSEVVRQAILDDAMTEITAIVRKPLSISHPKLKIVLHQNFLDYADLSETFKANDACLWCLGISQTQVNKEEYHSITYDYCMSAANEMLKVNPAINFIFLSGAGADSEERSRTLFARVKGKTENALQKLPFKKLYIARPAAIRPIAKREKAPLFEKILIPLFPIFQLIIPSQIITSVDLAKALLHLAKKGADKIILENVELKKLI